MNYIDLFNGDADGIISLLQLRLEIPISTTLITGVKRDIQLLDKIEITKNDYITILDISMDKNQTPLLDALEKGASIFYADHHQASEIPKHKNLEVHIDHDANICTSLIINRYLNQKHQIWAIVGAYGDNLYQAADQLCKELKLTSDQSLYLKELGTLINYNSYGETITDLHFHPAVLYQQLKHAITEEDQSPFVLQKELNSAYYRLKDAYHSDLTQAQSEPIHYSCDTLNVYLLPYMDWSRRINGPFGNFLANATPNKAHAILTETMYGDYVVSLRAPLNNKQGADIICSQFATGGGRSAAAGINNLPKSEVEHFITIAQKYWATN